MSAYDSSICHIHGKAFEEIVLGFDDHYTVNTQVVPAHIKYEKYYLRILKHTDNNYVNWIKETNEDIVIDVVGHSLSPADGDVLRKILTLNNASIVVYCKDEDSRAELIKNMAIILQPEKLIELTNDINPRVVFELL